jgi:hypothetical protein
MKNVKKEAKGRKIAGGEVENRSAAVTGGPKNSNKLSEIVQNCKLLYIFRKIDYI